MQNFWKSNCKLAIGKVALLGFALIFANTGITYAAQKMPSVAEVFGGLSEEQIAEQVQMGQKFLEDLEKNGTPEERAEFERLLVETLNSMSEEDKNDILAISQMVEPHLNIPAPEQPTTQQPLEAKSETKTETRNFETKDVEEFKKLISTIIQRIEDILLKLNSSKECAEEIDVKWNGKVTFSNMKRQIAQLKTDRLAQKLAKADNIGDDKDLVDTLKKFLKELSQENDALVIEDDFGLPVSYATEKKHLKQAKAILNMFDDYIDKLMPTLEKFLRKWDPEALQMAQEADAKSKKAGKDALDATKPAGSARATATPSSAGAQRYPGATNAGYPTEYGQYPEYYDQGYNPYSGVGAATPGFENKLPETGGSPVAKAKSDGTTVINKEQPKEKGSSSFYNSVISALEGHIADEFTTEHENNFVDFMKNVGAVTTTTDSKVPAFPPLPPKDPSAPLALDPSVNWVTNDFEKYSTEIKSKFESFGRELKPMYDLLEDTKHSLNDMTANELTKLQSSSQLANIERRVKRYADTFEVAQKQLEERKIATTPALAPDPQGSPAYIKKHEKLTDALQDDIGKKLIEAKEMINTIKHSAKRIARLKKTEALEQKATPQIQKVI